MTTTDSRLLTGPGPAVPPSGRGGGGPASGRAATPADQVRPRRGRRRAALVAGLLAVSAGAVLVPRVTGAPPAEVCGTDAVQAQALAGLADFSSWLERNGVPGYVGEVGWPAGGPDQPQWEQVARVWYRAADRVGLPVTAWAAARWPADYPMGVYRASPGSSALDTAGPQAAVVEDHASSRRALRGVALAGGSFGTSGAGFDAARPGRYGHDYSYENRGGYRYLASRGVRLVRLALVWERLQPRPGGPLRAAEVSRLRKAVAEAHTAGLEVILDLHGYGQFTAGPRPGDPHGSRTVYALGSGPLPTSALADFWARTVRATQDLPGVLGYDLLNEPVRLAARGQDGARLWERAAQESVDAIRAAGSRAPVFVAAYGRGSPLGWSRAHGRPWVHDPLGRAVYEIHVYFDSDGSGRYAQSYSGEAAGAGQQVVPRCQRFPDLSELHGRVVGRGPWWGALPRLGATVTSVLGAGPVVPPPHHLQQVAARTAVADQPARMRSARSFGRPTLRAGASEPDQIRTFPAGAGVRSRHEGSSG